MSRRETDGVTSNRSVDADTLRQWAGHLYVRRQMIPISY